MLQHYFFFDKSWLHFITLIAAISCSQCFSRCRNLRKQKEDTRWWCQCARWELFSRSSFLFSNNYSYLSGGISLQGIVVFRYLTLRIKQREKTQCGRHQRSAAAAENAFLSTLTLNRVSRFGWGGGCCCITPPAMPCENTQYVVVTMFLLHFTHCVTWNKSALTGGFTIGGCWGRFTGTICGTAM